MSQIYISVGSNIDKQRYISNALNALETTFNEVSISSIYESEAVGFKGTNFYNLVVGAQTSLSLEQVVEALKRIEQDNDRVRSAAKFSPRTLDLDLLTYDDIIAEQPAQIPRDEITKNAFVLWPLAEIAPTERHPVSQLSYQQLWQQYDQQKQKLWVVSFNRD
ncbi:MAG: 2-amino-4-hydroxy-6-hydroxymethyldihydropteridine diphosphokinase [Phenylobacterium sp.]